MVFIGGEQMNLDWIWKTIILFIIGRFILRLGGRKSVAQLTVTQTVAMIGLGTILVHPITSDNIITTLLIMLTLILLMIIFEYLEIKFDFLETIFAGKAIIVIENGKPNIVNLKKIRMSIDSLEQRLRKEHISSIEDVEYATIEVSGELGYALKKEKEPATKGDLDILINEIKNLKNSTITASSIKKAKTKNNIFTEVKSKKFEGNKNEP
jgi:uncharacterized membrane protein YcaP (DUF421 family)